MEEKLRATHPDRFDIPNVHNIGSFVTTCLKERRREAELAAAAAAVPQKGEADAAPVPKKRYTMPASYADEMERLVRAEPTMKPAQVQEKLSAGLGVTATAVPSDMPTEKQLKSKHYSLKSKLKKESYGQGN